MRKTASLFLLAVVCLLASPGCYYDNEEELYPNSFCDTVNVTYSGAVSTIINTNCAVPGCHVAGGTGTGNFTIYNDLKAQVDNGRLLPSVRWESGAIPMPTSGKLRDCDVRQLEIWVAAGAPNN